MFDPSFLAYAVTSAGVAGVGLRTVFAHAAGKIALKRAAPEIDSFGQAHAASPMGEKEKQGAKFFGDLLEKAHELRQSYKAQFDKLQINTIKIPPSDRLLSHPFAEMGTTFIMSYAGVEAYNFTSVYSHHIDAMMKGAAHTIHKDTFINFADAKIIEALDKAGVSDVVMQAIHGISHVIPNQVSEAAFNVMHEAMLPGVMTGVMTIINEGKLAFDGENTWEDALKYGVLPAVGGWAIVQAGMAVDAASAGATLGLGTLGGIAIAIGGRHVYISHQIEKDIETLTPHATRVKEKNAECITAINTVILEEAEKLSGVFATCPDVSAEKKLKVIFEKLTSATATDFAHARQAIEDDYLTRISALPEGSWLDKVFFTDTKKPVKDAYRKAANSRVHDLQVLQTGFVKTLNENPSHAAAFLMQNSFFSNGEFAKLLKTLPEDLKPAVAAFDGSLKKWGESCKTQWEISQAASQSETERQNSFMETLRGELAGIVNPLRMRIKANSKRLGRAPDPIISF